MLAGLIGGNTSVATAAGEVVADKDVVTAAFGAAAGIAGLTLVFLGVVLASYQSYDPRSQPLVLGRYRKTSVVTVGGFSLSIVSVAISLAWLLASRHWLFVVSVGAFVAQLVAIVAVAVYVTFFVLLKS
jgi:hypothetical protein